MNKIKATLIALMAVLATGVGVVATTAPANAATKHNSPCITRAEFGKVHNGMTLTQVKRIVGGTGRISLSSSYMTIRDFNTCTAFHVSNMSFIHGRVSSKLYI